MNITDGQVAAIREWAESHSSCVLGVHLFGSRARGDHRADSDIDIAILLDTRDADPPLMGRCFGLYIAVGDDWQEELSRRLGVHVSLEAYGEDDDGWLPDAVGREGIRLWPT
jgi:predicted nucleotidyltransferase